MVKTKWNRVCAIKMSMNRGISLYNVIWTYWNQKARKCTMEIWSSSLETYLCKKKWNSGLEWLQLLDDDLDSTTWPYGVNLEAWNGLKRPRTLTGVAAALASNLKSDFVILRFLKCVGCLDNCYMLFMRCWNNLFGLYCFLFPNSIVTCKWSKTWRFERNVEKAWT